MALTQQRAEKRFACIKQGSITYDFHVSLEVGQHYNGLTELTFSLNEIPTELELDFKCPQNIKHFVVNGQVIEDIRKQDGFILLDGSTLKKENNSVSVFYRNKYDNDGSGCVSFTDVDTKQYLYTQFESYFANRVFAVFDQPDLKARMRLNVIKPKSWAKVLSNEYPVVDSLFNAEEYHKTIMTNNVQSVNKFLNSINAQQSSMTLFPETKPLPTYLYCFIAGDYQELKLQQPYNGIPMSLYCIQSLYKYMKEMAPFIFEITIESMKFFEQYFGYKYAFSKYDQVFAHEYKWGAMQNAAIVTHNDRYIWKDKVSIETQLDFANTISHQLAHHWFGNLVTMKWWDDLWLNQSFADYISHFCLEKIKKNCKTINYESSMASFLNRKGWGYDEDQMITTHPIRGPVPNTSVADSIFDGITYAKGASTMKQLTFLMSEERFSKALCEYFHKFEWNNATLDDFIAVLENHFETKQFSLKQWRTLWLEKACCNKIEPKWNHEDKSQNSFIEIRQTCVLAEHPTLRMHRIKIGLFKQNGQIDAIEALINPCELSKVAFDASKNYKAVLLNYQDHTFAKTVIDPVSLDYFSNNLSQVKDLLSRTLIWKTYYDMVKDAEIKSTQHLKMVTFFLHKQSSDTIFETQLDYLYQSINDYTPKKFREELNEQVFQFIFKLLTQGQQIDQNRVVVLKEKLVTYAKNPASIKILLSWFNGEHEQLKKHQLMLDIRWSIVIKVFALSDLSNQQKWSLFQRQQKQDPSDTAKNNRYLCESLVATKQQFEKIYQQFKDPKTELSITVKRYMARGWNHPVHSEWLLEYRPRYFADIVNLSKQISGDHFTQFYKSLQPIDDDLQLQIEQFNKIKLQPGKYDKHSRDIMKIVDELKRRLKTYQLF